MPLIDKYRDMGTVVMGKIESGSVRRGDTLMVMPNKVSVVLRWSVLVDLWEGEALLMLVGVWCSATVMRRCGRLRWWVGFACRPM